MPGLALSPWPLPAELSPAGYEIYECFSCAGRLAKRTKCEFRSIQFDVLEDKIQDVYNRLYLDSDLRTNLEGMIRSVMKDINAEVYEEQNRLETEKLQIQRKQHKLLEAHYSDAIPVELLREEQKRLEADLTSVTRRLNAQVGNIEELDGNLSLVMEISENLANSYKLAPPHIRRMLNQLIFERIDVFFDPKSSCHTSKPDSQKASHSSARTQSA